MIATALRTGVAATLALCLATSVVGDEPPLPEQVRAAIERGIAYLETARNADGSWGSHDPIVVDSAQLGFDILKHGCHDGMRYACTAICAKGLLLVPGRGAKGDAMLARANEVLLAEQKLAYDPGHAFNTWGYAYLLDYLVELADRPEGAPLRARIDPAIDRCIAALRRLQQHEGGWAYYVGPTNGDSSMSFVTATVMIPMMRARALGRDVPEAVLRDAGRVMRLMTFPDKTYMYGYYLRDNVSHVLEDLGNAPRTQASALAMHLHDGSQTRADLARHSAFFFDKSLDYLEKVGNKRIIPHRDAPHNISGYFFYYGLDYAARTLALLGDAPDSRWDHLARAIVRQQERDGSWWDTMCYGYGKAWGTGLAMSSLARHATRPAPGVPADPPRDGTPVVPAAGSGSGSGS